MGIISVILILIVGYFVFDYIVVSSKINKAKSKLGHLRVSEKYRPIIDTIIREDSHFYKYRIVEVSTTQDNLCSTLHSNTIVLLVVYDDIVHIEWKYKYYYKEIIKEFSHRTANFSEEEQIQFATKACNEMKKAIRELKNSMSR